MTDQVQTPPPPDERVTRPKIGDWNHLEASVGQRGEGKSTHQCYRALELSREAGGAYVIGHSLGARLPRELPAEYGGTKLPIVYHKTLKELEKGLRRSPDKWHILAPPIEWDPEKVQDSADDLIRYAIRLSEALKKAAWQREHMFGLWNPPKTDATGLECVPVIVVIDEGIAVEAASTGGKARGKDKWFLQFIYSLRHNHIALLYSIQDASARSWRVLEQANLIHCFYMQHQWALSSIQAAGASREQILQIQTLDQYDFVTIGRHRSKVIDPEYEMVAHDAELEGDHDKAERVRAASQAKSEG